MFLQTLLISCVSFVPLEVDSSQSSIEGTFEQSTFLPGTLIGNWDAVENPEGTSTIEGVWGGSGNNFIPCELTPTLGGPFDSICSGSVSIEPDAVFEMLTVDGFVLSAFNDAPGTFQVTLGMLYETFRSVQPDSLYPGGIQVDIPLGEGSLDVLQFEQVVSAQTKLIPAGDKTWSFVADIPVTVTMEMTVFETPSGPIVTPGLLQLTGTLVKKGNAYEFTASTSIGSKEFIEDVPIEFENVPFEAPTIIPSGQIAHLLLSAQAEYATLTMQTNIQITAVGEVATAGDVNGDGVVGVNDLLAIVAAWGPCAECNEDINNDGLVNVTDLLEVIGFWSGS